MENATERSRRYHYLWIVGACVYLSAVWYVGWEKFQGALLNLEPMFLICTAATLLASLWLRVLKWRLSLDVRPITQLYFMSKAGGEFTPSRVGELSPLAVEKYRTPRVAAWIVVDRLLEITATLAFGAFGAIALGSNHAGLLPTIAVASIMLVVVPVFVVTRQGLFERIERRTAEHVLVHRATLFLAKVSGEIRGFGSRLLLAAGMTLIATGLDVVSGILIYRSFGQRLPFSLLAAAQCMHGLVSAIPFLPNITGAPYVAVGFLVNKVGGAPVEVIAAVVTVFVLLGSTTFWGSLGISAWIWGGSHPQRERTNGTS